jgi:hypothetical protein
VNRNVGSRDRWLRTIAAIPLLACSVMAPLPLAARLVAFAAPAAFLLITGLTGFCPGYKVLGRSTCATAGQRGDR